MWTKFVNWLGIETKVQKAESERLRQEMREKVRTRQAQRRLEAGNRKVNGGNDSWKTANAVIKTTDVPKKKTQKTSSQVRAERYGTSHDEGYLTPGFNSYYAPVIMDAGGYDYDYMETSFPNVPSSSDPAPAYSDSSSSSSYDPPASSSSSYDPPASSSYSYDPPASSYSYDSGSSYSSSDSGSSGGGSFGE